MNTSDIGVIVGRFQTHRLTEEHKRLILHVVERHSKTLIFLGVARFMGTERNPLDFMARKLMIEAAVPALTAILPLQDEKTDAGWSATLDRSIRTVFPTGSVTLYGGRDSFANSYTGRFPVEVLEPKTYVSATELREQCGRTLNASEDYRAGVIYASQNQFPHTHPTVDIAVRGTTPDQFLLGRKPDETALRFIGGFVDPKDASLEAAARREAQEETGLAVDGLEYIGSFRIDDWRCRGERDGIMTTLFVATAQFGAPKPGDDIAELMWVSLCDKVDVEPEHVVLWDALKERILGQEPNR